jgi:hypothetical protein
MKRFSPTRRALIGRGLAIAALYFGATTGAVHADSILWYNGDFDGNDAIYNAVVPSVQTASVYDDFIVPTGQTWSITSVFSNNLLSVDNVTSAYYEIRSDISLDDGGSLLFSGTELASQVDTGRNGFGVEESTVTISGLSGIMLAAGTYWLTVNPIVSGDQDLSYITTTSGANAIGMPPGNDDNSYIAGSYYESNGNNDFDPASDITGYSPADFSMGVSGTAMSAVPEPSALVMGVIATVSLAGYTCRVRSVRDL